jgi:dTMP kinase
MKKGKFIVIDGIGGCGKTTQARLLGEWLGRRALVTHEPGGAPKAEMIRKKLLRNSGATHPLTDFFLFWAARVEHVREKISPALKAGKVVISDRFDSATYGFQIYGEELTELKEAFWATRKAVLAGAEPDLYIILDLSVEEAEARRKARPKQTDRFDEKDRAFQRRVRAGFKAFVRKMGKRAIIVNANRPMEVVDAELKKIVERIL